MTDEYTTYSSKDFYVVFRLDYKGDKIYLADNNGSKKKFTLYNAIFDVLGFKDENEMSTFGLFIERISNK